ncbi:MAG: class I SAM-dependent methyltransferase [Planctomycetota bacterium]|nr:class I SAM-dependent methyltransferase [Planctomycetota bacterium]
MRDSPASPAWFRRHFNEDYLVLYSGRSQEQAEREVGFIVGQLEVRRQESVLDLCCGFGRHLRAFRRRGIRAVGVDLSAALLTVARERLDTELVCADMLQLPFRGGTRGSGGTRGFEVLVNFFTSFGYFESRSDNHRAASEMARVLRPGGRFSLDLMNRDRTLRELAPRTKRRSGQFEIHEERSHDRERDRIDKRIVLHDTRSGDVKKYFESVQLYGEEEISRLLCEVGLEVTEVFGDFADVPFDADSPRMIVTGRRSSA